MPKPGDWHDDAGPADYGGSVLEDDGGLALAGVEAVTHQP